MIEVAQGFTGVRNDLGDTFGLNETAKFVDFGGRGGRTIAIGVVASGVLTTYHDSRDLVRFDIHDEDGMIEHQWLVDVSQLRKI